MITRYSDTGISFAVMVEHPGGRDGGDFVQEHSVGVDDQGRVEYEFQLPDDLHNNCEFGSWSFFDLACTGAGIYLNSSADGAWADRTLKNVVSTLKEQCKKVGIPIPDALSAALDKATELIVYFDGKIIEAGKHLGQAEETDEDEDEDEDE